MKSVSFSYQVNLSSEVSAMFSSLMPSLNSRYLPFVVFLGGFPSRCQNLSSGAIRPGGLLFLCVVFGPPCFFPRKWGGGRQGPLAPPGSAPDHSQLKIQLKSSQIIVSPVRSTYGGYYGLVVVTPRPRPHFIVYAITLKNLIGLLPYFICRLI